MSEENKLTPEEKIEMAKEMEDQAAIHQARMMFCILMDAAMRYREIFWMRDIENVKKQDVPYPYDGKGKAPSGKTREKYARGMIEKTCNRITGFNNKIYNELHAMASAMSPEQSHAMQQMATAFGSCCEELLHAKSKTDMLVLMKLYNAGHLDETFAQLKKIASENKEEPEAVTEEKDNVVPLTPNTEGSTEDV